jgi:VanZ family protein
MQKKKTIAWGAVLAWMALIFFLSHQPAEVSSGMSSGIAEKIMVLIETSAPAAGIDVDVLHTFVRKNAHFFAYLILGVLAFVALLQSGLTGLSGALAAFGIAVGYAISDEAHQLFIPGRSGEVRDVLIDSTGAAVGIGIYLLLLKARQSKSFSTKPNRLQESNE